MKGKIGMISGASKGLVQSIGHHFGGGGRGR